MTSSPSICASCLRALRLCSPTRPLFLRRRPLQTTSASSAALSTFSKSSSSPPIRPELSLPCKVRSRRAFAAAAEQASSPSPPSSSATPPKPRNAAASEPPPRAIPIYNPRKDASGNPQTIYITPRAAHRLAGIVEEDNNPRLALRVTIESGGCHGFQYLMSITTIPENIPLQSIGSLGSNSTSADGNGNERDPSSSSSPPAAKEEERRDAEEDTVFEGPLGTHVVIDSTSLELLAGSTIDYTMELIGSQFKVTGIPGATSSCGCGTSFDVKF